MVVNLIARRFVAMFYDMAPPGRNAGDGWAYDKKAVDRVGDVMKGVRSAMQGAGGKISCNYYACVFLTPKGKRVGAYRGLPAPKLLVKQLKEILAANPELARPSAAELKVTRAAKADASDAKAQLAAARDAWLVADWEACRKYLAAARAACGEKTEPWMAEIDYIAARVAIWHDQRDAATKQLAHARKVDPRDTTLLGDDILAAQARVALDRKQYAAAVRLYRRIAAEYPDRSRAGEALYFAGVACWYNGQADVAREFWQAHVKKYPKDRLARRSAISLPGARSFRNQELVDRKGW